MISWRLAAAVGMVFTSGLAAASCGSSDPATPETDAGTSETGSPVDGGAETTTTLDGGTDTGTADTGVDAGPECNATTPCSGTLTCCSNHCVDTKKNPSHCGACGVSCTAGSQFCNGVTCKEAVVTNVCQTANATVIQDGIAEDDSAGTSIATALGGCTPAVTVRTVLQATVEGNTALAILSDAGAPLSGPGDMLVTAGGEFGQHMVKYMETKSSAPVVSNQTGTTITFSRRSTGAILHTLQDSDLTASHDYALIALAVDAPSGTLTVMAQGLFGPGTRAASFQLGQMIAAPATYDQAFYLYEWTDGNANQMPDVGEFVLRASGK
ncbi:MAG: Stigma-specific protein Stig1 [Myxococcaceae bacterium]|nr:Stigma-specific protein Stig1 [Myxococcaceae bacterium]